MFISPRFLDIFGTDPIKTRRTDQEVALDRPEFGLADEPEKESADTESLAEDSAPQFFPGEERASA